MEVLYPHSAGLDVHKKTVVAAVVQVDDKGRETFDKQTFGTMTRDLLALADWLVEQGVTHVAMESTGEYWKPVYNLLEDQFVLLVVNAQHVKQVPGRKTDLKDAEWLSKLLAHGLLKASFIPPPGQRELREMTRARAAMVRERTNLVNRLQKTLESANLKLTSVVTNVQGVSARALLETLLRQGALDIRQIAGLVKGSLRSPAKIAELERALEGRVKPHHRFILTELLRQIDGLDETLARFDTQIEEMCLPFEQAIAHLDTIPGVGRAAAEQIVAEIGADLHSFPTAGHLAAWAGVAPGSYQSGGKTLSSRTRQGNPNLKRVLTEAAHAAVKVKNTYLSAQYHRLVGRRGTKRAIIAVAHSILVIAYHLITRDEDYKELGGNYFDTRQPVRAMQNLVQRLVKLGYEVQVNPLATTSTATAAVAA